MSLLNDFSISSFIIISGSECGASHQGATTMRYIQVNGIEPRMDRELIYDPKTRMHSKAVDDISFTGDFECGNCGQVFRIDHNRYEIHITPDPDGSTQWFFFRVDGIEPGRYMFVIAGLSRSDQLHWAGSQIVCRSDALARKGVGWRRFGDNINYFRWGLEKIWALSFDFVVEERDTMHFAHLYPYTFTDLGRFLDDQAVRVSVLCRSRGGIEVPCIFWDAEQGSCVPLETQRMMMSGGPSLRRETFQNFGEFVRSRVRCWGRSELQQGRHFRLRPLCIVAARTHPGETCGSFAMEGFLQALFSEAGRALRQNFSWLIIPMLNPDGVVCGFYRPCLCGSDQNRVWGAPDRQRHPEVEAALRVICALSHWREVPFILDFHGHTAATDVFTYGFPNEHIPELEGADLAFPRAMAARCSIFHDDACCNTDHPTWDGTMRQAIRRRFHTLFSYTIEMSFGGAGVGPRSGTQFTPDDYRQVGIDSVTAIADILLGVDDRWLPPTARKFA
jgi:hypothetical protein